MAALGAFASGGPATAFGVTHGLERPRVAFVVPGQGGQWTGMARDLVAQSPVFRASLEACDAAARRHVPWSIMEQLGLDEGAPGFLGDRLEDELASLVTRDSMIGVGPAASPVS